MVNPTDNETRSPVILVVDDEREVRLALRRTLERDGYTVVEASDGSSALGLMADCNPAVVISDYRMAGVDGVFVLKKAKALFPAAQRIMLTGHADMNTVEEAINEGEVHRFLSKPWDIDQLLDVVKSAVERHLLVLENSRLLELTRAQNTQLSELAEGLESKVNERTELLIRAKRAWEKTFDAIVDPFALIDVNLNLVRGNLAWAEAVGVDIREAPGMAYYTLFGGALPEESCPVSETFRTREGATAEIPSGDESRVYRVWTFYMEDESGSAGDARVVAHYKDVTEQVSMERQLVQSEKLAAVGQLAGGVAHEINNPLSAILAFSQLGIRDVDEGDELHEFLTEIEEAAQRCKEIVRNLLTFSRAPQRSDLKEVDVNDIVRRAGTLMGHEFDKGQVSLNLRLEEGLPPVSGSGNQLMQVIVNFMSNAVGAIGGVGTVDVSTTSHGGCVRVSVTDSGPGVPEEYLQKIFEPFFTTKEEGKGTGLGLSVSYGIIQAHKGTIHVTNNREGGATFSFELPRAAFPVES